MATPDSPSTARAALFEGPEVPLRLARLPIPPLGAGELLVGPSLCTLCASDRHTFFGRRPARVPLVLGHEIVGRIAAFGPGEPARDHQGRALERGERVVWSLVASCGECFFCRRDLPQKCESAFKYGHESALGPRALSGGLAELCVIARGTTIVSLPEDLPDEVAAPAGCVGATAAAALRVAESVPGEVVAVLGAGMLGLCAAAMAKTAGAQAVVVCDPEAGRRGWAERFGADLAAAPQDLAAAVQDASAGRGADVVLELSGARAAVFAALELARVGGRCVLAGTAAPTEPVGLDPERVVRRMLCVRGLHNYAPRDLATAVEFLDSHHRELPFAEAVGEVFDLERAQEAFLSAERAGGALRVAVAPGPP